MKFYFVRHGKTEWNLARRLQGGHGDSPLLEESYRDIAKLGTYLSGEKFKAIYSSPLQRAFNTAQAVDKAMNANLSVIIDERLREFDLGKIEGMKFEDAEKLYPSTIDNFWHHPEKYDAKAIEGESYQHVIARGKSFAKEIAQKYPNENDKVLVISHGAALSAIMGGLMGYPLKDIRKNGSLYNTGLTILETNDLGDSFKIVKWNETSYLDRKLSETDSL